MTEQTFDIDIDMTEFPTARVGIERYKADKRQLGGILLLLGTCAAFQPLTSIASLVGYNSTNASTPLERASLFAGLIELVFGSLAMLVGYLNLVHDLRNSSLSGVLILITQLAWAPFITAMVAIGKEAVGPYQYDNVQTIVNETLVLQQFVVNSFVPSNYLPSERDVRFFGAMGILGLLGYGIGFFGSLAFVEFAIYAFDKGKPDTRSAEYYRGCFLVYTFILVLAGMSQLLLGAYSMTEYGMGPYKPPVTVGIYNIYFPQISVAVGLVQMLIGYYGFARYLEFVPTGPKDHHYQILILIQWFSTLFLQNLTQIAYAPGNEYAASLQSAALLTVGLNIILAFLEYKMRTTPIYISKEYYGIMVPKSADDYQDPVSSSSSDDSSVEEDFDAPQDEPVSVISSPEGQEVVVQRRISQLEPMPSEVRRTAESQPDPEPEVTVDIETGISGEVMEEDLPIIEEETIEHSQALSEDTPPRSNLAGSQEPSDWSEILPTPAHFSPEDPAEAPPEWHFDAVDDGDEEEEENGDAVPRRKSQDPPERGDSPYEELLYKNLSFEEAKFLADLEEASTVSISDSEPGLLSEDTPDDSSAALNKRLEAIENNLFTETMEAYNKTLKEFF